MQILDNINSLWGDELKQELKPGAKLKIAASCFSIYAYEALRTELEKIESLEFIFTSPAFLPQEATDKVKRERKEFHIPKLEWIYQKCCIRFESCPMCKAIEIRYGIQLEVQTTNV